MKLVTKNDFEPRFHEALQCYVHHVFYDFDCRCGRLCMGEDSCCDMTAAIALFTSIDPTCRRIDTFRRFGEPDTTYRLIRGEWTALDARPLYGA